MLIYKCSYMMVMNHLFFPDLHYGNSGKGAYFLIHEKSRGVNGKPVGGTCVWAKYPLGVVTLTREYGASTPRTGPLRAC
jgi:hypothetical protein